MNIRTRTKATLFEIAEFVAEIHIYFPEYKLSADVVNLQCNICDLGNINRKTEVELMIMPWLCHDVIQVPLPFVEAFNEWLTKTRTISGKRKKKSTPTLEQTKSE